MVDRFWVGGSGDTNDTAHWSATSGGAGGASVPTSSDNATFDSMSNATTYAVTTSVAAACNALTIANPLAGTVTLTLGAALTAAGTITLTSGTLDFNDQNVTAKTLSSSNSNVRTLTLGSGVFSLTATFGTRFNVGTSTNLTMTATTGTIRILSTTTDAATFSGGGKAYGILDVATDVTGGEDVLITGANTFIRITATGGGKKQFQFPSSTTTTLTGTTPLPSGADAGNRLTFSATASGSTIALTFPARLRNVSIDDISITGAAAQAVASIDGGGNTGWTFPPDPDIPVFGQLLLLC